MPGFKRYFAYEGRPWYFWITHEMTSEERTMIRLTNVSKRYGKVEALKGVTLDISEGEFVLLTGPSGAGKTTLLRTIFAAVQPDEGDVCLDHWNVARLQSSSIPYLRRNIGVVFQDFKLLGQRSALGNVAVSLEIRGMPRAEVNQRSTIALESVGLGERLHTRADQLSGGEQQRVAIARAVVGGPTILLADEPTGNLDPELALGILDLLARIVRRGTTVIVATHDPLVVQNAACNRVISMEGGQVSGQREITGPRKVEPVLTSLEQLLGDDDAAGGDDDGGDVSQSAS